MRECKTVHLPDILPDATKDYSRRYEKVTRTGLGVPLLKDQTAVDVIMLFRKTVRPFTERQIALVNTFAEQALTAMENTRLFEEVQARTRELTEALEQETATADVLKVISRSTLDLQRALDALVEPAARPCNAYDAAIFQVFGDGLRLGQEDLRCVLRFPSTTRSLAGRPARTRITSQGIGPRTYVPRPIELAGLLRCVARIFSCAPPHQLRATAGAPLSMALLASGALRYRA